MEQIISYIVQFVETLGYPGIFIMTFLESTFVPIPSEITMIPAGYLVSKGQMNFVAVLTLSTLGTVSGAYFNYWLAFHYGRKLFTRYGKYFFMNEQKLIKIEDYFRSHGPISTFLGRLLPGIRHYISFPAGLGKMNRRIFFIYTAAGGFIWILVLITLGYYIGENEDKIKEYVLVLKAGAISVSLIVVVFYLWRKKVVANNKKKQIPDDIDDI